MKTGAASLTAARGIETESSNLELALQYGLVAIAKIPNRRMNEAAQNGSALSSGSGPRNVPPRPCTKAGAERDSPATIRSAGRLGLAKYALPVLRHALRGARMQLVDAR